MPHDGDDAQGYAVDRIGDVDESELRPVHVAGHVHQAKLGPAHPVGQVKKRCGLEPAHVGTGQVGHGGRLHQQAALAAGRCGGQLAQRVGGQPAGQAQPAAQAGGLVGAAGGAGRPAGQVHEPGNLQAPRIVAGNVDEARALHAAHCAPVHVGQPRQLYAARVGPGDVGQAGRLQPVHRIAHHVQQPTQFYPAHARRVAGQHVEGVAVHGAGIARPVAAERGQQRHLRQLAAHH